MTRKQGLDKKGPISRGVKMKGRGHPRVDPEKVNTMMIMFGNNARGKKKGFGGDTLIFLTIIIITGIIFTNITIKTGKKRIKVGEIVTRIKIV